MDKIINIIKEEPIVGEDGLNYIKVTKEILTPRKTFLKGIVSGKYRGDKIPEEFEKTDLYDFEIYEAKVICNSKEDFSKNIPFIFPNDFKNNNSQNKIKGTIFPKEKLPTTLAVQITANDKTFGINVLEPKLFEFNTIRKLHQIEGDQVYGSFNAFITGFVLDYERAEVEEIIGPIFKSELPIQPTSCKASNVETGQIKRKGNYISKEYLCKNHENCTVWSANKYVSDDTFFHPNPPLVGCFSNLITVVGLILGIAFFIIFFPSIIYLVIFYIIIFVINWLAPFFKWIFRIAGLLFLLFFIGTLIHSFSQSNNVKPKPVYVDNSRETTEKIEPIVENNSTTDNLKENDDYLIKKYREWSDYDGNFYSGYYTLRKSEITQSKYFKNNLNKHVYTESNYDEIIFDLKENDKTKLQGVYKLFDSIGNSNKLNNIQFAEMVVTFVQDIPYVLILEKDCDPNLYTDSFTRTYLRTNQGKCSGSQKFGINTPVEFLYTLDGDCDTRTLLIYTILSHYNYDVAIMSSEFYSHSILGINLPLNGLKYKYQNQNYVLWETTQRNIKPGKISSEISNLNYWRISLKSK